MQKKEKEPPAEKPRGAEKETERAERERLKKINKIPDYEALFFPRLHTQSLAAMDNAACYQRRYRPHYR